MRPPTLVIGEALLDILHREDGTATEHIGGSPTNVAIGLSRLGHPVELATHVGTDARGRRITEHLAAQGIWLTAGSTSAPRTSTATAALNGHGGASYTFDLLWEMPITPAHATHVHTGSIGATLEPGATAVLDAIRDARPRATISYDPNVRPTLLGDAHEVRAKIEQIIGLSDVVKASQEDIDWLYAGASVSEVLRLWGRLGPELIVITEGAEGAVIGLPASAEVTSLDAVHVPIVDTIGAGDSFMAGLLSGLLDADLLGGPAARERLRRVNLPDVRPAVARAIAAAAVTVSRAGANPPTRAELHLDRD